MMLGFRFSAVLFCLTLTFGLQATFPTRQFPNGFHETLRIGRGSVQDVEWHPGGEMLLVDTIIGAWLYTPMLEDIAYLKDARLGTFSPDGRWLAGVNSDNHITLWNAARLEFVDTLVGHDGYVDALEWSPDGTRVASLSRSGLLLVHDVANRGVPLEIQAGDVDKIVWSRGGSYLAALDTDSGIVEVWDESGESIFTATPDYPPQYGADFDWRDDTHLLRWIMGEFTTTDLWDVITSRAIDQPDAGQSGDLAYSPDGRSLAAGGRVDNADGNEIRFVLDWQTTVVEWSPDSQWLAIGSWNIGTNAKAPTWVIDATTGEVVHELGEFHRSVARLAWNNDGSKLLVMDSAHELSVWDSHSGQRLARSSAHTLVGNMAAWRPDGSIIATPDNIESANLWDASTGSLIASLSRHNQPVTELDWQPGGSLLATRGGDWFQSADYNLRVWDLSQDASLVATIPHESIIADVAWSPDGSRLASAVRGNIITLWSAQSRQLESPITTFESETLLGLQWSYDGAVISTSQISSGNGGFVALWDATSGNAIPGGLPLTGSGWVWTPQNQLVWANWGHYTHGGVQPPVYDITIWIGYNNSPDTLPPSVTLSGLHEQVTTAAISPDGWKVVGFDRSNTGVVWAVRSRRPLFTLDDASSAVWSPNSTMLAVFSPDYTVQIVDAWTGTVLTTFEGYEGMQLIWSPDSHKFALLVAGVLFIYESV